jgi:hypothetical protein
LIATFLPVLLYGQTAVLEGRYAGADFELTADPRSLAWRSTQGVVMESDYFGSHVPNHRTEVRSRWTKEYLYLLYVCQYEQLNLKPNPSTAEETPRLWNWDVAEAFLGSDPSAIGRYKEFQVSPQGEWVDLEIDRTGSGRGGGAAWNSGIRVKSRIDPASKTWYGEMKIPFAAIGGPPAVGRELHAGFFRIAGMDPDKKKISWQATGRTTFHVPEKFGVLRLVE